MSDMKLLGAIEGGGTKMVCAIGHADGTVLKRVSIPTEMPETTIPKVIRFFQDERVEAICVASFGPVALNKNAPNYGSITSTPKLEWVDIPIMPIIRDALDIPAAIELDVNAAAYGEWKQGAGRSLSSLIYITVGTGIGAGVVCENNLVHGLVHPEFGHMLLRPHPNETHPDGFCPYHRGCLEGMASGPAMEKRFGIKADRLDEGHTAWDLEAYYLAQGVVNAIVTLSPERIILGGGVMHHRALFPQIGAYVIEMLNGYIRSEMILKRIAEYITPPALGDDSAIKGCLLLAAEL